MNKKNLVLACKCALLLALIGFFIPLFNGVNGFSISNDLLTNEVINAEGSFIGTYASNLNQYDVTFHNRKEQLKDKANSFICLSNYPNINLSEVDKARNSLTGPKMDYENAKSMYLAEKKVNGAGLVEARKAYQNTFAPYKAALDSYRDTLVAVSNSLLKNYDEKVQVALDNKESSNIDSLAKKYTILKEEKNILSGEVVNRDRLISADDSFKKVLPKYKFAGFAFIIFGISLILSIIYTAVRFLTSKNFNYKYNRGDYAFDIPMMIITVVSCMLAFVNIKKLTTLEIKPSIGYFLVTIGILAYVVLYLFSTTLDENISSKTEERRAYWMLSLPAIIFYFAVMTFPAVFSIFLSFTDYRGGPLFAENAFNFIGVKNYAEVFKDPIFYLSLKNNIFVVLISVLGQLPLGFFLAYVLNRGLVKGRDFFQSVIYLPCVISTVVIGILFQTFFSPANGAWPEFLRKFNPAYEPGPNNAPMIPVLFVMLWMYTGTYLIIFLANLQKLDPGMIEAATIDGATEGQVLWHIIFPQLSGTFVISAILAISGSLKSFDLIYVMTQGGPAKQTFVLSLYMFDKAFGGAADYPVANTISTIMVVISLVLIAIVKTLEKKFGAKED